MKAEQSYQCKTCGVGYIFHGTYCLVDHPTGECCHYEQTCMECEKNIGANGHCQCDAAKAKRKAWRKW